jgi:hypothetical protein
VAAWPKKINLAKTQRSQSYNLLLQKAENILPWRLCAFAREITAFMDGN